MNDGYRSRSLLTHLGSGLHKPNQKNHPPPTRVELIDWLTQNPKSLCLVTGYNGCGKTTELIETSIVFQSKPQCRGLYLDVGSDLHLTELKAGDLLRYVTDQITYHQNLKTFVVFVDSLDLLSAEDHAYETIGSDLLTLKSLGIGVVVAGSPETFCGYEDRFDFNLRLWDRDVSTKFGQDQMMKILMTKLTSDPGFIPLEIMQRLVALSGGVVRIMLSLLRDMLIRCYMVKPTSFAEFLDFAAKNQKSHLFGGFLDVDYAKICSPSFEDQSELEWQLKKRKILCHRGIDGKSCYKPHPLLFV